MHNLVWLIVTISVGLIFGFLSGGLFSADYTSFWSALGSIGTLGAWYFLYEQSKATNEQLKLTSEQVRQTNMQLQTIYRTEITNSIEKIIEYLLEEGKVRFDRVSWINAAMEVDNIAMLIKYLPKEVQEIDTERYARLLDSKLPVNLFQSESLHQSSLLIDQMDKVHSRKGVYSHGFVKCNMEFAGREHALKLYMFTREYEFAVPQDFRFRAGNFFWTNPDVDTFKCPDCLNVINK
ncbi:hypothetical protein [Vibrio fluvialis]|uniref:Uncharacterized protein n=1 Tax=Vibrio fluvialis PG41 TaxID=1336752 RepID=S7JRW7_VIBFL|nr:hypothetical protein [Vibrio fluvialis]EPP24970.1 hypothetical protein L910_0119 [Vibrio fluvialis PG41]WIE04455.1 hypothetical protein QN061_06665 [Vibrio fluvialis]